MEFPLRCIKSVEENGTERAGDSFQLALLRSTSEHISVVNACDNGFFSH